MVLLWFFTALVLPTAIRPYLSDSNRLKSSSIQSGLDALLFQAHPFPTRPAVMRGSWRDPSPNTARAQLAQVRQQLDVAGFQAIHVKAPPWLQIAMEQSLVTLQARKEICNTRYADYRDGHLFVIRDKVSGESDMAFIKIAVTSQLEDIRRRSLGDGVLSTFLVHRAPDRRRRNWIEGKGFPEAREASGLCKDMEAAKRPTFHEIRGA
jgi:hypothetical protein